jgi:hypothetical protein
MKNWNVTDADGQLSELALEALCCGPQRMMLDGEVNLVVLSAAEYARLTGEPQAQEAADSQSKPETGLSWFAAMRRPFEEAAARGEDVYWPWDWDWEKREWVLPVDNEGSS